MRKRISRLCSVSQTAQLWLCTATWSCNGQETELYKTTKVMQMISIGLIYVAELHKWTRDNLPFYWSLGSCVTYVQSHRPYTKDCLKKNVPPWKFNNWKNHLIENTKGIYTISYICIIPQKLQYSSVMPKATFHSHKLKEWEGKG